MSAALSERLALSILLHEYQKRAVTECDLNIAVAIEDLIDGEDAYRVLPKIMVEAAALASVVARARGIDIGMLANILAEHVHDAVLKMPDPPALGPRLVVDNDPPPEVKFQ